MADKMTDAEIVAGLRSEDTKTRQRACDALYPSKGGSGGAVLVRVEGDKIHLAETSTLDANRMFPGLLYMAQNVGKNLGLTLGWVPDPEEQDRIQVVPHLLQ